VSVDKSALSTDAAVKIEIEAISECGFWFKVRRVLYSNRRCQRSQCLSW